MLRTSFRHLAVGLVLLCCSTVHAQNWYSDGQQPASGAIPPTRVFAAGYGHPSDTPSGYQTPQPTFPPNYTAGPYQLPAPTGYSPESQQYGNQQYGGQTYAAGSEQVPYGAQPVPVEGPYATVPSCGDGSCGGQNLANYGPGGYGATAGYGNNVPVYGGIGPMNPSGQTAQGPGFFFRYDRLYSSFNAPDGVRDIGNAAEEGTYIANGIPTEFRNSLNTGFVDDDFEFNGDRIEFGFLDGCGGANRGNGWVASILSIEQDFEQIANGGYVLFADPTGMMLGFASAMDADGNEIDADVNGNYVYGRNGVDLGTLDPGTGLYMPPFDNRIDGASPQDNGDLVSFVPIYGVLTARSTTSLSGLALSRFRSSQLGGGCSGRCFRWLYGIRYLNLKDQFSLVGDGSNFYEEMTLSDRTKNFIIGPELGFCLGQSFGPWSLSGQLRFTAGANFLRSSQTASFVVDEASRTPRDAPLNLFSYAVSNQSESEFFSPVAEWRIDVAYALAQSLSLRAGYTGIFIGEVARAGNVNYTIPDLGLSGDRGDVYMNALSLGLELAY